MAKVAFGNVTSDVRGSIGAVTYSRSRTGAYARSKSSPVQPRTPRATLVRNRLAAQSSTWRTLTDQQRAAWSQVAATLRRTDQLGNAYNLTGQQLFAMINSVRLQCGDPAITAAPPLDLPPLVTSLSITAAASSQTVSVSFGMPSGTSSQRLWMFASNQVSAGRAFFSKSRMKWVAQVTGNATPPLAMGPAYRALYGDLRAGARIAVLAVPISANRFPGAPVLATAVIAV